jgi:hypothetical protein
VFSLTIEEENNKITDKALRDAIRFAKSMIGSGWPKNYALNRAAEYCDLPIADIKKYIE